MVLALGELASEIGSFIRKDLLSVFLPGFVILVELWVIADYPRAVEGLPSNTWVEAIVVVYFSYVAGFCARQVTFLLAERKLMTLFRIHRSEDAKQGRPFGTLSWGDRFYNRDAFDHNYDLLAATFSKDLVDKILDKHPFASQIRTNGQRSARSPEEPEPADYREIFHYCKLWLRANDPVLATDAMEIEFNLQLSIVIPLLLLPWALWRGIGGVLLPTSTAVVAVLCTMIMYRRGNHVRHAEVFDVLRNLLIASWCHDTRLAEPVMRHDTKLGGLAGAGPQPAGELVGAAADGPAPVPHLGAGGTAGGLHAPNSAGQHGDRAGQQPESVG